MSANSKMISVSLVLGAVLTTGLVGCIQKGNRQLDSQLRESALQSQLEYFTSNELTVHDMTQLVRDMQRIAAKPEISMDDYLGELKKHPRGAELFSNFTAAFISKAAQEASPEYPRIIMATESGGLTATFNSGNLLGNEEIEINQVHPVTRERMLFHITFPIKTGQVMPELEKNPSDCQGCHVLSNLGVQHLWGRYPKWQGVIGGEDDFVAPSEGTYVRKIQGCAPDSSVSEVATPQIVQEYKILQHLRQMVQSGAPRYRHLDFPKGAPDTYPYSSDPKGYIANRPNFRFGGVWHRHHIANLMYQLKKAGKYDQFGKLELYGYFSCSSMVAPDLDARLRSKFGLPARNPSAKADQLDVEWMEAAVALAGVRLRHLSLNENPAKFENNIGYSPGSERSTLLMARMILEEDAATRKTLPHSSYLLVPPKECEAIYDFAKFPSLNGFGLKPTLRINSNGKPSAEMCDALAQQMLDFPMDAQREQK